MRIRIYVPMKICWSALKRLRKTIRPWMRCSGSAERCPVAGLSGFGDASLRSHVPTEFLACVRRCGRRLSCPLVGNWSRVGCYKYVGAAHRSCCLACFRICVFPWLLIHGRPQPRIMRRNSCLRSSATAVAARLRPRPLGVIAQLYECVRTHVAPCIRTSIS